MTRDQSIGVLCLCVITFFFLSCKKCETRYEPDFTEDELSWVNISNVNPSYQIRYKQNNQWYTDTVTGNHIKSGVIYSSYTEGDCEDNVKFPTANIEYCIPFPESPKCFQTLVIIRNDRQFSVRISNLDVIFYNEVRLDTATILGRFYNDVYRGVNGNNGQLIFSKKYGLIYMNISNSNEAKIII